MLVTSHFFFARNDSGERNQGFPKTDAKLSPPKPKSGLSGPAGSILGNKKGVLVSTPFSPLTFTWFFTAGFTITYPTTKNLSFLAD
jgi:hypothetical protein